MKVLAFTCFALGACVGAVSLSALQPSLADGPDNGPVPSKLLNAGLQMLNAIEPQYRTSPPGQAMQEMLLKNGMAFDNPQRSKAPYVREIRKGEDAAASEWEAGVPNPNNHEGLGWDRASFTSQEEAAEWASKRVNARAPIDADMEPPKFEGDEMRSQAVDRAGMQRAQEEEAQQAEYSDSKATYPPEELEAMKQQEDENQKTAVPVWAMDQWQQENAAEMANDQRVGAPSAKMAAPPAKMAFRQRAKGVGEVGEYAPDHDALQQLVQNSQSRVQELPQVPFIKPEAPNGQLSTPEQLAWDRQVGQEDHMEFEEKRAAMQADQAKDMQTEYSPAEEEAEMSTGPLAEREHALKVAHKLRDALAQYQPPAL